MCRVQEGITLNTPLSTPLAVNFEINSPVLGTLLWGKVPDGRLGTTWRVLHKDARENQEENRSKEG